ncbi:MAG: hypothetical protein IMZ64_02340 [Bacteroidetes bacterium]|nr:hypothetical protein [Bacteroidota bacterium]
MDEELKRIIDLINGNPHYEVKYVLSWTELGGNVDSVVYDTYEDICRNKHDYNKILPVIVEKD